MESGRRLIVQDLLVVLVSVVIAVWIAELTAFYSLVRELTGSHSYILSFVAGIFFTSIFTVAPAVVILGEIAQANAILPLALIGGLGAMCGDYMLFWFFKDHVRRDADYLLGHDQMIRWQKIFGRKAFRWFLPFVGAVILASPLPDEIGLALLGFSKLKTRYFLLLSFLFNVLGILLVGYAARGITS
jgi:hypothetical protein